MAMIFLLLGMLLVVIPNANSVNMDFISIDVLNI
jgi:hypothetical protein